MNKKERTVLKNLVNSKTTLVEKFQNEVIRPVIKMQHQYVILFFKDYLQKRKIDFETLSGEQKKIKIQTVLKTDFKFKTLLIGCIIGQFAIEELEVYLSNTSEFNRRITQISMQRLQDSIPEL